MSRRPTPRGKPAPLFLLAAWFASLASMACLAPHAPAAQPPARGDTGAAEATTGGDTAKPVPAAAAAAAAATKRAPAGASARALPALPGPIRAGGDPSGVDDLKAMEAHVQALLAEVLPATVGIGGASGVIVEGGIVLTCAHVTREKGRTVQMRLHDGRRLEGITLGLNHRTDAALVRITTKGEFPFRPMGRSSALRRGEWCLMLGHPSGQKPGRAAPARLGRVLVVPARGYLVTDCTMQAGDSGGPLFDMDGNVVGINSRINGDLAQNMHVPVDAFHDDWDRLLAGDVIEAPPPRRGRRDRLAGASIAFEEHGLRVTGVPDGSGAAAAGLAVGDVILRIGEHDVTDRESFMRAVAGSSAGTKVAVHVRRGDETLDVEVELPREQPREQPRQREGGR